MENENVTIKCLIAKTVKALSDCFGFPLIDFVLQVPKDYDSSASLKHFANIIQKVKISYGLDGKITGENFLESKSILKPEGLYRVRVIPIIDKVTSEECVEYLTRMNTIFVGGHGLELLNEERISFLNEENTHCLIEGKHLLSFDGDNQSLWKDLYGYHYGIPSLYKGYSEEGGGVTFEFGYLESSWWIDCCLLCFTEY